MSQYKINFNNINWESPIKGVKQKCYRQDSKQIRIVEYSKGMPIHWCNKGHYGIILEGEFEIEFENGKIIYKKGDGVFIPGGDEHKHRGKTITETVKVFFVEDL